MGDVAFKQPFSVQENLINPVSNYEKGFSSTKQEWASENRQQIHYEGTIDGVIYTIPENKVLYITSACASCYTGAVAGGCGVQIRDAGAVQFQNLVMAFANVNQQGNNSISYNMPIKAFPGQTIYVLVGVTTGRAYFDGYLEDF